MRGKEKIEEAVGQALKQMNVPTRTRAQAGPLPHRDARARGGSLKAKAKARPAGPAQARPAQAGRRSPRRTPSRPLSRIAITGTASYLGARVLRRLVEARGADAVRGPGHRGAAHDAARGAPPHGGPDPARRGPAPRGRLPRGARGDRLPRGVLHDPPARRRLLARARVDRHAAPRGGGGGGRGAAPACCAPSPRSTARGGRTRTSSPRRGVRTRHSPLAWVRDKVEAEEHAFSFSRRYPGLGVTVLRFATLLGPGVHTFYTRIFSKRVVPVVLGYDPLVQLLHPDDALDAVDAALAKGPCGVVNVVPRDTMSLLTALHLSDKLTVAVPHVVAYPVAELWWGAGRGGGPGRLHRLRAVPLRGRRREGPARARLRGPAHEPGRADGLSSSTATPTRPAGRRSRGSGSARKRTAREAQA